MYEEWLKLREKLLFNTPPRQFGEVCGSIRAKLSEEYDAAGDKQRTEIVDIIGELCIDTQSYLRRWNLQKPSSKDIVSDGEISVEAGRFCDMLNSWGAGNKVSYIRHKVTEIGESNLLKLSVLTDNGILNNRYGNDYGSGLAEAMRKGAILATTNPIIINNERKENPALWDKIRDKVKIENPGATGEQLASIMTMQVVLKNCRELRPVFNASDGQYGYICLQVNPENSTDGVRMAEEAMFLYEKLKTGLNGVPNVLFKLPGTEASLKAAEKLTSMGIGVTITVSFSVDQLITFAKVIEKGIAKVSYVVVMTGRLDDPIRDELTGLKQEGAAEAARWASTAVIRKAYNILYKQYNFTKSQILAASLRGPWNIDGALTDGIMPVIITSFPDKAEEYDSVKRELISHINEDIPGDMLEILMKSRIFREAYIEGTLSPGGFDSFYPVVATLNAFAKSYREFVSYINS